MKTLDFLTGQHQNLPYDFNDLAYDYLDLRFQG